MSDDAEFHATGDAEEDDLDALLAEDEDDEE